VLAGPILALATNSPLLFGKRLWAETRVPLFEQAVDTRRRSLHGRAASPRVGFGTRFLDNSIVELFRQDILRFRALVSADLDDERPSDMLDKGAVPGLKALRLHNGTVYRWNRACYGVMDGLAHLRIENRVLPSGPTVLDEVANAALWCGLMVGMNERYPDVKQHIDFGDASSNFYAGARQGLTAHFKWLDGKEMLASQLLLEVLLPVAEAGLKSQGVDAADIQRYLKVVEERVATGRTGSRWALSSLSGMKNKGTPRERHNALVAATIARQSGPSPVSQWDDARLDEGSAASKGETRVDQYMVAEPYTVQAEDAVDLVVKLMEWENIDHVPVEDREHQLLGLLSHAAVMRHLEKTGSTGDVSVADLMKLNVITVSPDTPTSEAIKLMRAQKISCLPVVQDGKLVGLVTASDFEQISAEIIAQILA
jgi:CBS domain-containing protein